MRKIEPHIWRREIKRLRNKADLTQEQAAERCEVARETYCKWETGAQTPIPIARLGVLRILKQEGNDE